MRDAFGSADKHRYRHVCPDSFGGPRTPSRTAITNLECVFGKEQIVFVAPKNLVVAPPLTRPGQNMLVNNFVKNTCI